MNSFIATGRLVKDPEKSLTPRGKSIAHFKLAVVNKRSKREDGKYDTDFFKCVAYGDVADRILRYKRRGEPILIVGEMHFPKFKSKTSDHWVIYPLVTAFDIDLLTTQKYHNPNKMADRLEEEESNMFDQVAEVEQDYNEGIYG